MAIQAAGKDLNREALGELVLSLRRDCREINREIKNLAVELRHKQQADASASAYELLQRVVEPILDEEDPATALT